MTIDERLEALVRNAEIQSVNIESLHSSVAELHSGMAELRASMADQHANAIKDGENIRALARIAEIHERRLTDLEGDSNVQ